MYNIICVRWCILVKSRPRALDAKMRLTRKQIMKWIVKTVKECTVIAYTSVYRFPWLRFARNTSYRDSRRWTLAKRVASKRSLKMRFRSNASSMVEVFESFVNRYLSLCDDDINGPYLNTPIPLQFAYDITSRSFIRGGRRKIIIIIYHYINIELSNRKSFRCMLE